MKSPVVFNNDEYREWARKYSLGFSKSQTEREPKQYPAMVVMDDMYGFVNFVYDAEFEYAKKLKESNDTRRN